MSDVPFVAFVQMALQIVAPAVMVGMVGLQIASAMRDLLLLLARGAK